MQINTKPIMIDNLNMVLKQMRDRSVMSIARISEGVIGTPSEKEDIVILYSDGVTERASILDKSANETFLMICSMITTHAALAGEGK